MKNNKKGFTLIEVLIAMSIILLIAVAFFYVINISIKNNIKNEKDIKLLNLSTSEIENIIQQIKDTDTDTLTINKDIDVKWNGNKIGTAISREGNHKKVDDEGNDIIEYKTEIDNLICTVQVNISRESKANGLYLYDIDFIRAKLDDEYFSKRKIELSTQIFGK